MIKSTAHGDGTAGSCSCASFWARRCGCCCRCLPNVPPIPCDWSSLDAAADLISIETRGLEATVGQTLCPDDDDDDDERNSTLSSHTEQQIAASRKGWREGTNKIRETTSFPSPTRQKHQPIKIYTIRSVSHFLYPSPRTFEASRNRVPEVASARTLIGGRRWSAVQSSRYFLFACDDQRQTPHRRPPEKSSASGIKNPPPDAPGRQMRRPRALGEMFADRALSVSLRSLPTSTAACRRCLPRVGRSHNSEPSGTPNRQHTLA
jgi:hypothetical protein